MKIGFTGIDITEGKTKFKDDILIALEEKDNPKKVSPYFAEFIRDEYVQSDAIVISKDNLLDLLILDMDKIETRLSRSAESDEKAVLEKCLSNLENEIPVCDLSFDEKELTILQAFGPLSLKPVVTLTGDEDINTIISLALDKADNMFFYTSGPAESHAWLIKKGSDIVTCAGQIHTDLARGFIKGDVVSFDDYMAHHSFKECISKGVAKLVDRDYIVLPGDIIEIRFSV